MLRRTKESNFTELELKQIKSIDKLQDDIKILKTEITELNKDKQELKRIIEFKEVTINKLQQENQQLKENYDRIYNENCKLREEHNITDISLLDENQQLKKQKDDAAENIKKQITFCTNEAEGTVNNDKCWMAVNYLKKILRMLGEIDE